MNGTQAIIAAIHLAAWLIIATNLSIASAYRRGFVPAALVAWAVVMVAIL